MAGFQWRRPLDIPISGPSVARAAAVAKAATPMSTVTGATAASEIVEAFLEGMHTFTSQMKESAKSQMPLTEDDKLDKPVPGIIILEPEMGHKITVSTFLVWLKSVEEAWVSEKVPQVIAKLRGNLRIDEGDLKKMLTEKVNQRVIY